MLYLFLTVKRAAYLNDIFTVKEPLGVRYQCGKISVNLREKAVLEEKLILKRNRRRRSREEK